MPKRPVKPSVVRESTLSATEFKATCLEVMDGVARGAGEVVVTKHGRPVVRIVPATSELPSPFGAMAGSIVSHGDIVAPDEASWHPSTTDPLHSARGAS